MKWVWKILLKNFAKKNFFEKFFFPVWTCIKPNLVSKIFPFSGGGSPWKSCSEWAETNFGFGIFEIRWFRGGSLCEIQMDIQLDTCHSDQISCSARRDGMTKNWFSEGIFSWQITRMALESPKIDIYQNWPRSVLGDVIRCLEFKFDKKFQWEVSQIAKKKFPRTMLLGGLSVNLNHLKSKGLCPVNQL